MKKLFRNENGFTLAEIIVSAGIIAIGGVILIKSGSLSYLTTKKAESSSNISLLVDDLVKGATNVLAKSEDANGNKVNGICPLVTTDAQSPGVGSINMSLQNSGQVFKDSRWKEFLTSWKEKSSNECDLSGGWGKCYEINYSKLATSFSKVEIEEQDIVASVVVYPVNMNPNSNGGGSEIFKRLSTADYSKYDAKDIGFEILATVYYKDEKGERTKKELNDYFWSPNVGLCDYTLSTGDKVKLSLNGAGASDPDGNTIYNRTGFTGNLEEPIDINWKKTQAQAGVVTNNGNFITTDAAQNIFGSCNETRYRCPQVNSAQREYGTINLFTNIRYNKFNKVNNGKGSTSMNMRPRIQLKLGEGGDVISGASQSYTLDGNTQNAGALSSISSAHTLSFSINDKNGSNATGICRDICKESNNFNTNSASWEDRFTPYLKAQFTSDSNADSYAYSSGQELGCTACYMKNCSQFGIGTFGPMANQPTQPLDSSLPECSLAEDSKLVNTPASFYDANKSGTPWNAGTSVCMSARLDKSKNELEFIPEDCNSNLPVLCYNFGGYKLARDVNGSQEAISYRNYNDAPRRCFEMGREVARSAELQAYLGTSFAAPQNGDGNYDFINVAQQGMFLAPQFKQDLVDMSSWFTENGIGSTTRFWVGMVRDGEGNMIARPPFAPDYSGSDLYALFFNTSGSLVSRTYPASLGLEQEAGPKGFLLAHHVKFKGLFPAKQDSPLGSRQFNFLCRKKGVNGSFFVSSRDSKRFQDGDMYCGYENGLFVPPVTPVGWVSAMSKVSGFHARYGYPNPDQVSVDSIPLVWVGITADGAASQYYKNWDFASSNMKNNGGTVNYVSNVAADNNYTVIDGDGNFVNPRAQLVGKNEGMVSISKDVRLEVYTNTNGLENKKLNDNVAPKVQGAASWVSDLNALFNHVEFSKIDDYGGDKYVVTGHTPGPGNKVKLTNSTADKFGFSWGNREANSPAGNHLCYSSGNGQISLKSYYANCDGHMIKRNQIIGTKSGKALMTILDLNSNVKIDLPQ